MYANNRLMMATNQKQVEIYAIYCKLTSVDTVHGKFEGEIDIVSSWFDTIHGDYDPERHWNPQLIFENIIDRDTKIRTRIEIQQQQNDNHEHYVRIIQYQKISGIFSEWLHVKQFPFDIQQLGVIITSLHTTSHIKLNGKQEYSYLARKAMRENDSWDFNQAVTIEYNLYQEHTPYLRSQQYPIVKFNALIARKSQFYITNLILPLFFVTSTIFVSFTQDPSAVGARLSACATTLLTSINFRFIIHSYLPNVSYSTFLDMYSMASIVFITLVFSWHAYSVKKFNQMTYAQLDTYVLCAFGVVYLLGHIFFITFAWILPRRRQRHLLRRLPPLADVSDDKQPIELTNHLGYERSVDKITME